MSAQKAFGGVVGVGLVGLLRQALSTETATPSQRAAAPPALADGQRAINAPRPPPPAPRVKPSPPTSPELEVRRVILDGGGVPLLKALYQFSSHTHAEYESVAALAPGGDGGGGDDDAAAACCSPRRARARTRRRT